MGLRAKDEEGAVISAPSLDLVLSYEFQIRKQMVKLMNEGETMREALDQAMKDGVVKERFFLTPAAYSALTAMGGRKEKSRSPRRDRWQGGQGHYASGSGGGKGKAKGGKGKKGARALHSKTPDGREICYAWNNKDQRCRHKCGKLHVCQICFGQHPAHACKGEDKKDTSGGGAAAKEKWRSLSPGHLLTPGGKEEIVEEKSIAFKVLYLFAGEARKTSVASFLKEKAKLGKFHIQVEEIDIMCREEDDLSLQSKQEEILKRIEAREFDAVICTPPCSTWSRVRAANMRGPPL